MDGGSCGRRPRCPGRAAPAGRRARSGCRAPWSGARPRPDRGVATPPIAGPARGRRSPPKDTPRRRSRGPRCVGRVQNRAAAFAPVEDGATSDLAPPIERNRRVTRAAGPADQRDDYVPRARAPQPVVAGAERLVDLLGAGFTREHRRVPLRLEQVPAFGESRPLGGLLEVGRVDLVLLFAYLALERGDRLGGADPIGLLLGDDRAGQVQLGHQGGGILGVTDRFEPLDPAVLKRPVAVDPRLDLVAPAGALRRGAARGVERIAGLLDGLIEGGGFA